MAAPQSPCVGICTLNRAGVCVGCGRTLDEIAAWPSAGDARREQIVKLARERRTDLKKQPS